MGERPVVEEDWEVLRRFLPAGWEQKGRELGAFRRARGFEDAEALLRVLLVHLAEGCSLRETAARASEGALADVSDVAVHLRLRGAGEWLRWMAQEVMRAWVPAAGEGRAGLPVVRVLDATHVKEPGRTGSQWRLFYSLRLPGLECDEVRVAPLKEGEAFGRYAVHAGELAIADRGYAHPAGIAGVLANGADVLVRINLTNVPLRDAEGRPFPLLKRLRRLRVGEVADLAVQLPLPGAIRPARVCAVRISTTAAAKAQRRAEHESRTKKHRIRPDTLAATQFVMVLTSLPAERLAAQDVLELYRARWQVELAFKRLKSLAALGHLKKTDPLAAKAWLYGKLLVALLVQAFHTAAQSFSPWGYPLAAPGAR